MHHQRARTSTGVSEGGTQHVVSARANFTASRVLTEAAIAGRVDYLRGLKGSRQRPCVSVRHKRRDVVSYSEIDEAKPSGGRSSRQRTRQDDGRDGHLPRRNIQITNLRAMLQHKTYAMANVTTVSMHGACSVAPGIDGFGEHCRFVVGRSVVPRTPRRMTVRARPVGA